MAGLRAAGSKHAGVQTGALGTRGRAAAEGGGELGTAFLPPACLDASDGQVLVLGWVLGRS